jgi:hypothetical protein
MESGNLVFSTYLNLFQYCICADAENLILVYIKMCLETYVITPVTWLWGGGGGGAFKNQVLQF